MDHKTSLLLIFLAFTTLFFVPSFLVNADNVPNEKKMRVLLADGKGCVDDQYDDHENKKERQEVGKQKKDTSNPAKISAYQTECGTCHFAYQAELLPKSSWMKLLASLDNHFGEMVSLDEESKRAITDHLKSNSAEQNSSKHSNSIMQDLGNQIPLRITHTPYIKKVHREISPDVLKREAIGSLSNCTACHTTAEEGIYDDDNVKIPK